MACFRTSEYAAAEEPRTVALSLVVDQSLPPELAACLPLLEWGCSMNVPCSSCDDWLARRLSKVGGLLVVVSGTR